jgi:hypothetical protein
MTSGLQIIKKSHQNLSMFLKLNFFEMWDVEKNIQIKNEMEVELRNFFSRCSRDRLRYFEG